MIRAPSLYGFLAARRRPTTKTNGEAGQNRSEFIFADISQTKFIRLNPTLSHRFRIHPNGKNDEKSLGILKFQG